MALSHKGAFIIGNTEFTPSSLKISYESIASEDSGRADSGYMDIQWVYNCVRKLEIQMPPMTPSEISALFALVQGRTYNITFWDIKTNTEMTKEVYTSTSSADCYSGVLYNGLYTGVSFNAIERGGEVYA